MIRVTMHPEIKGGHWVHKKSPPYLPKESCFLCHWAHVSSLQGGCPVCGHVTAAHFCSLTPKQTVFTKKELIPFPLKQRSLNPLEANAMMFKLTPEACCPGSRHPRAFPAGPAP